MNIKFFVIGFKWGMLMKKQVKGFVLGVLVETLLTTAVFGDSILETIKVKFNSVNIQVNGKK